MGNIFTSAYSTLVPLFKGVLKLGRAAAKSKTGKALTKELKESVVRAGVRAANDIIKGENVKQSGRKAVKAVAGDMAETGRRLRLKLKAPPPPKTPPKQKKKTGAAMKKKSPGFKTAAKASQKGRARAGRDILSPGRLRR